LLQSPTGLYQFNYWIQAAQPYTAQAVSIKPANEAVTVEKKLRGAAELS